MRREGWGESAEGGKGRMRGDKVRGVRREGKRGVDRLRERRGRGEKRGRSERDRARGGR